MIGIKNSSKYFLLQKVSTRLSIKLKKNIPENNIILKILASRIRKIRKRVQLNRKNIPKKNMLIKVMSNLSLMNILIYRNMIQKELQVLILKLIFLNHL